MEIRLETLLNQHRYEEILQAVEGFVAVPPVDPVQVAEQALYAARAAGRLERYATAVEWAERGLTAGPDTLWTEGMLRLTLGRNLIHTGDLIRAEREFCRFLELGLNVPELAQYRPTALFNLAYLYRVLDRGEQEVTLFCEAAAAFEAQGNSQYLLRCRYELAWHHLSRGDAEAAWPHLQAVLSAEPELIEPEMEMDIRLELAWHQMLSGQTAEAEAACLELMGLDQLKPQQRADVAWLLGMLTFRAGDLTRAGEWATMATRYAAKVWWPPQMERAAALQREIAGHLSA
jgi:tetratricopeptide (TPR) repeat protein